MKQMLQKLGYAVPEIGMEELDLWRQWYGGKVAKFHNYSQYNGKKKVRRTRAALGMAKKVCEDWANLLMNEKVAIGTSDAALTKRANEILEDNQFRVRGNRLVELSFALGTGAFVAFLENGKVCIDYVRADMIFPLAYHNGVIESVAFGSLKNMGDKQCVYLQVHEKREEGYVILNYLFDKERQSPLPLPDGLVEEFHTKSQLPLFQIVTPNIVRNSNLDSPMGAAIYANALDVLAGIDLVYDSLQNEFRLGKKRIVVPVGMAQLNCEETGFTPVFDENDTEFYAFTDRNLTDLKEINMNIRAMEHAEGLRQNLNLLSDLCGLGRERYTYDYDRSRLKTATEVISEESSLYQNLKKHELVLRGAVIGLVRAVLFLDGHDAENLSVTVEFDDGIIHDTNSEFQQNLQLVDAGILKPYEFRMWWLSETEAQAKKMCEEKRAVEGV